MIDVDELKQKWADYDGKIDESIRLNRRLLSEASLDRARGALRRVAAFQAIELAMWAACVVVLGNFAFEHLGAPKFALAGVALDLYAIANIAALVRLMMMAAGVDYGRPIAEIQRQLEELRVRRVRRVQVGILAGVVAWAPFVIVVMQGCFGLDAYRVMGAPWLAANVLFGLALIPLVIWMSKKYGDRMGRSPFVQRIMADLAGHNLTAAQGFLAELAEFARVT